MITDGYSIACNKHNLVMINESTDCELMAPKKLYNDDKGIDIMSSGLGDFVTCDKLSSKGKYTQLIAARGSCHNQHIKAAHILCRVITCKPAIV